SMALQRVSQMPVCTSTRTPKPSAWKRAQSISQPITQRFKKLKAYSSNISAIAKRLLPTQRETELTEISDIEAQRCAKQLRGGLAKCLATENTMGEGEEEQEENEEDEEEVEENEEEEEEEEEEEREQEEQDGEEEKMEKARPFRFQTTWKALCGKEHLSGIHSGHFTKGMLFMIDIELWKEKVLRDLQPRTF
ncbi:MAG: hypothetical protein M1840_002721, partial [Geoglossum simile]